MDIKNCKQADLMEEQLKKLGARVEKFLSHEVNYVISSSGPTKADERLNSREENPQSPSFVPSPFNCGPSPTGQAESRTAVVSRGKALAQIACAKNKASTVVASAEKLGIKVVSAEAAVKWLEKEIKKMKCVKESRIKENKTKKTEAKRKENNTKSKLLKGSFIKFEDKSRHYRPLKLELDKWPKLNLSAPPGICPFGEAKVKVQNLYGPRNTLHQSNVVGCGTVPAEQAVTKPVVEGIRPSKKTSAVPELVGVPIVTTGDARRILNFHFKKNLAINKQQGYCDCCGVKFQNVDEHVRGEEHRSFARQKSNYESLDALISQVPSTVSFLQSVLLKHCVQKQVEPSSSSCTPTEHLNVVQPLSPLTTEKTNLLSQEAAVTCLKTPEASGTEIYAFKNNLTVAETDLISRQETTPTKEEKITDSRPQAVVIRRPQPSGIFTSPRRRQPTPTKKPWIQECSMVFRDSPIASLQPSPCGSGHSFTRFHSDSTLDVKYNKVKMSGSLKRLTDVRDKSNIRKPKLTSEGSKVGKTFFSTILNQNFANLSNNLIQAENVGVGGNVKDRISVRRSLSVLETFKSPSHEQAHSVNEVEDSYQKQNLAVEQEAQEMSVTSMLSVSEEKQAINFDASARISSASLANVSDALIQADNVRTSRNEKVHCTVRKSLNVQETFQSSHHEQGQCVNEVDSHQEKKLAVEQEAQEMSLNPMFSVSEEIQAINVNISASISSTSLANLSNNLIQAENVEVGGNEEDQCSARKSLIVLETPSHEQGSCVNEVEDSHQEKNLAVEQEAQEMNPVFNVSGEIQQTFKFDESTRNISKSLGERGPDLDEVSYKFISVVSLRDDIEKLLLKGGKTVHKKSTNVDSCSAQDPTDTLHQDLNQSSSSTSRLQKIEDLKESAKRETYDRLCLNFDMAAASCTADRAKQRIKPHDDKNVECKNTQHHETSIVTSINRACSSGTDDTSQGCHSKTRELGESTLKEETAEGNIVFRKCYVKLISNLPEIVTEPLDNLGREVKDEIKNCSVQLNKMEYHPHVNYEGAGEKINKVNIQENNINATVSTTLFQNSCIKKSSDLSVENLSKEITYIGADCSIEEEIEHFGSKASVNSQNDKMNINELGISESKINTSFPVSTEHTDSSDSKAHNHGEYSTTLFLPTQVKQSIYSGLSPHSNLELGLHALNEQDTVQTNANRVSCLNKDGFIDGETVDCLAVNKVMKEGTLEKIAAVDEISSSVIGSGVFTVGEESGHAWVGEVSGHGSENTDSSNSSENTDSFNKRSEICHLMGHEDVNAKREEGYEHVDVDQQEGTLLETVVVPNIADRVKCRSRVGCLSSQSASDKSAEVNVVKKGKKRKRKAIKHHNKRTLARIVSSESDEQRMRNTGLICLKNVASASFSSVNKRAEETEGVNELACMLIVPNIAESVKKRRSCTMFNHDGQYANSGEGNEGEIVNVKVEARSVLKCRRRHYSTLENKMEALTLKPVIEHDKISTTKHSSNQKVQKISTEINSDDSIDVTPKKIEVGGKILNKSNCRSKTESELADLSSAIVIRRRKSGVYPTCSGTKRPEVDWGRLQAHSDNSSDQDNNDNSMIKETALICGEDNHTSESHNIFTSSLQGQFQSIVDDTAQQTEMVSETKVTTMDANSITSSPHHTVDETMVIHRAKYKKAKRTRKISQTSCSNDLQHLESCSTLSSSSGISCSPRLRLKIWRRSDDKGFSSTLQEIHDLTPEAAVFSTDLQDCTDKLAEKYTDKVFHKLSSEATAEQHINVGSSDKLTSLSQSHYVDLVQSSQNRITSFKHQRQQMNSHRNSKSIQPLDSPLRVQSSKKRIKLSHESFTDSAVADNSKTDFQNELSLSQKTCSIMLNILPKNRENNQTSLEEPRSQSPCFSSPVSKRHFKCITTPKKSNAPDRSILKSQSPVFNMSRKNLKNKRNSQNMSSAVQISETVIPQKVNNLSFITLKNAGLEANVVVDCSIKSKPLANTHTIDNGHHVKRMLSQSGLDFPTAKRFKVESSLHLVSGRNSAQLLERKHDSTTLEDLTKSPNYDGSSVFRESSNHGLSSDFRELPNSIVPSDFKEPSKYCLSSNMTVSSISHINLKNCDNTERAMNAAKDKNVKSKNTVVLTDRREDDGLLLLNSNNGADDSAESDFEGLLIQVPTFSSPDKVTDSSWGDVCDSYLSTSINKHDLHASRLAMLGKSPDSKEGKDCPMSPFRIHSKTLRSPTRKRTPKKESIRERNTTKQQEYMCKQQMETSIISLGEEKTGRGKTDDHTISGKVIQHELRTPVKNGKFQSQELSPYIQQVDEVISFNYMSPRKLNFSPQKLNFSPHQGGNKQSSSLKRHLLSPAAEYASSPHTRRLFSPSKNNSGNEYESSQQSSSRIHEGKNS